MHSSVARMPAYATAGPSGSATVRVVTTLTLLASAALAATSGAIHLHLWADGYRTIPTIGPLFLFQGIAGVVLAVVLAASRRLLAALATAGFMVATIGGFLLSVYVGLFGFSDTLAAPWAGVSLVVEIVGTVVLVGGSVLVLWRAQQADAHELHPGAGFLNPGSSERAGAGQPYRWRSRASTASASVSRLVLSPPIAPAM